MGLPVIATQIPGCFDAVDDGVTGILVPAGDAHELARAMTTYARDSSLRNEHGRAGRARVLRQFSRGAIHQALLARYLELAARSRTEPHPETRHVACAE
jgi:glycosyltransferase involved in cell wall biosynthesis